jgi:hypothetical protein
VKRQHPFDLLQIIFSHCNPPSLRGQIFIGDTVNNFLIARG